MANVFSYLKEGDEVVTYRVPHPDISHSSLKIRMLNWKAEGMSVGDAIGKSDEYVEKNSEEVRANRIILNFQKPTVHHDLPDKKFIVGELKRDEFDVLSAGMKKGGHTITLDGGTPSEYRQVCRKVGLNVFCYWYCVNNGYGEDPHNRSWERSKGSKRYDLSISGVNYDGDVFVEDEVVETPYTINDMEVVLEQDYESPVKDSVEEITSIINGLEEDYPPIVAREVIKKVRKVDYPSRGSDLSEEAKKEKKRRKDIKEFFSDIDGVGRQTKRKIIGEFEDLTDVYNDVVRNDGERLMSIRNITEDTIGQIESKL